MSECPLNCSSYIEFCYIHCKNFDCPLEHGILSIIANRFAVIYGAPESQGPCACMGIECGSLNGVVVVMDPILQSEEENNMMIF